MHAFMCKVFQKITAGTSMEDFGHVMVTTISGCDMKDVLLGVARYDHASARKCAMKKPVHDHTPYDLSSLVLWGDHGRETCINNTKDLLDSVSSGIKKYVDSMIIMFPPIVSTSEALLGIFNMSACIGKVFLECYTL